MKKFLSFILALSIVLSCVSMVTFASGEAEKVVGVKFTTANSTARPDLVMWGAGDASVMSANSSYNGPLTLSYYVYNPTNYNLTFEIKFANNSGNNAGTGTSAFMSKKVLPGGMQLFTISVDVVNGKATFYNGEKEYTQTLNNLRLRMTPTFSPAAKGNVFYMFPAGENPEKDGIVTKFTDTDVTKELVTEYPSHKGVEITTTVAQPTNGYDFTNWQQGMFFAPDETLNGEISKTYTIFNTSTKQLKVSLNFALVGIGVQSEKTSVVIPAGSKANLTVKAPVENGIVQVKDKTATIDKLTLSWNFVFTGGSAGDKCVIAPYYQEGETDSFFEYIKYMAEDDATPKLTTAKVDTLPDYEYIAGMKVTVTDNSNRNAGHVSFTLPGGILLKGYPVDYTGTITISYVVYNTTEREQPITVYYSRPSYYGNVKGITYDIPANKKQIVTSQPLTIENGYEQVGLGENGEKIHFSDIRIRLNLGKGSTNEIGDVYYVATLNDNPDDPMLLGSHTGTQISASPVTSLPDLSFPPKACGIAVATNPTKTEYEIGENFVADGLTLNLVYDDGSVEPLTEAFTTSGFDSSTPGVKPVTVKYGDYTTTFEVTVLEEPKYAGVKYTFNSNADAHEKKTLSLNNTVHFTDENVATFTGDVSKTYTFYNHSDKMVVVTLNFAARVYHVVDGTVDMTKADWVYAAASKYKTASILPGQSITLTITEQFVDGAPVDGYAATNFEYNSLTIEDLFPQISVTFVTAAEAGDVIVIGTDDTEDAIFTTGSTFGTKETAENLITLPELQKVDLNAAYKFEVNTNTIAPNYPRIKKLGLTTDDIIVDENGRCILLQYRVYNMSGTIKYFIVQAQNAWLGIENIITYPGNKDGKCTQAIQPYSSAVYTVRIAIDENNKVNGNNLEDISIRFIETLGGNKILKFDENGKPIYQIDEKTGEIIKDKDENPVQDFYYDTNPVEKVKFAGEVYYIQALNEVSRNIFYQNPTDCSNFTLTTITDAELDKITKFAGVTPEIGSSIALNIVTVPMHDYIDGARLKVTRYNGTDDPYVVYLDPIDVVTLGNITYKKSYGTLVFRYKGINAQCMADDITFELVYGEDNKTVATAMDKNGEVLKYSIKQYALNQYANGSAELKQLLNDMLVYGAAAQDYMNYREDNLATAGVEWISETTLNVEALNSVKDVTNNVDKAITRAGLEISYVNKIYFRVDETKVDLAKIWVTKNNGEAVAFSLEGNVIYTDAIKANGFDDVYTINVTLLDGTVASVQYNVNAYIANKYNSETVGTITTALGNYGAAAVAYQASLNA